MANFYEDNEDIKFHLRTLNLRRIAWLQEEGFRDAERCDYAPRDEADAIDGYGQVLKLVGDLAGAYSRRINIQHRLVYQVIEDARTVKVIRMWTHYE
jgi:plasmid maintenance system killer protein